MKILIVDDSETMRTIIVKSLRQAGFDTFEPAEASSAREALALIAKGGIDLVLSDVNMPEISDPRKVSCIAHNHGHHGVVSGHEEENAGSRR